MAAILCFGEVLWDLFPTGRFLGGAPLNVAYHLAQLGHQPSIVSCVGTDFLGNEALRAIAESGVAPDAVARADDLPTGVAKVTLDAKGSATFELPAPVAWDRIPTTFPVLIPPAVIVFGTLALRSLENRKSLQGLLDKFPTATVICDVNLRKPYDDLTEIKPLLARAHVMKVNEAECLQLSGGLATCLIAAFEIQARYGVENVCVTRAEKGAMFLHGNQVFECEAPPTVVVDTVGAGDAFTAGLVAGLCANRANPNWNAIVAAASQLGSFVASRAGAQPSHDGFSWPL